MKQLSLRTCRKTCFHQALGNAVMFHSRRNWFETSPLPKKKIYLKLHFLLFLPPEAVWIALGQKWWIQVHFVKGQCMYSCIFPSPNNPGTVIFRSHKGFCVAEISLLSFAAWYFQTIIFWTPGLLSTNVTTKKENNSRQESYLMAVIMSPCCMVQTEWSEDSPLLGYCLGEIGWFMFWEEPLIWEFSLGTAVQVWCLGQSMLELLIFLIFGIY